jgi:3-oxoacyl-[acyl-carrier protein] reductase
MINYGLKDKVVLITGTNNPKRIGAKMALSFAEQVAKVAMVYKKMEFEYKEEFTVGDSLDSYFKALSMDCSEVEAAILKISRNYVIIESDISAEGNIASIYEKLSYICHCGWEKRVSQFNIKVENAGG